MVKHLFVLLAALVALTAPAQVVRTNDIMSMNPAANPVYASVGDTLRYTVYARKPSGAAYDLTGLFGRHIVHESRPDFDQETTGTVSIIDATNGCARVMKTFGESVEGWHRIDMFQVNNSNFAASIAWDDFSITNATTSAGGGDCNVSVTATTVVQVADGLDTFGINGHQTSSVNIAVSGGLLGIESNLTTGTFTLTAPNPYNAPTNAGITYTWQATAGTYTWAVIDGPASPPGVVGTNYYYFTNYQAGLVQPFIVPPGVTSLHWFVQGAGGANSIYGGNGEMREAIMPTLPGTVYAVGVALPGSNNIVSAYQPNFGGWPNGGDTAIFGDARYCGSGGGFSFVAQWLGSDWGDYTNVADFIVIAAGGPGGYSIGGPNAPNSGSWYAMDNNRNTNGYLVTGPSADDAYGANHKFGTNAYTSANLATNFLVPSQPANLGVATNLANACGGGGGWICGPGGVVGVSNATVAASTGCPGLGWANTNYVWWSYSTRSSTNAVSGIDAPYYVSGRGHRGQPGYVSCKY